MQILNLLCSTRPHRYHPPFANRTSHYCAQRCPSQEDSPLSANIPAVSSFCASRICRICLQCGAMSPWIAPDHLVQLQAEVVASGSMDLSHEEGIFPKDAIALARALPRKASMRAVGAVPAVHANELGAVSHCLAQATLIRHSPDGCADKSTAPYAQTPLPVRSLAGSSSRLKLPIRVV